VRVAVIGTGLIGTSVALALREQGAGVWLADADPEAARLATAEHRARLAWRIEPGAGLDGR
jgi:prephenate dehydrogenase